jgi:hypothetical protein
MAYQNGQKGAYISSDDWQWRERCMSSPTKTGFK